MNKFSNLEKNVNLKLTKKGFRWRWFIHITLFLCLLTIIQQSCSEKKKTVAISTIKDEIFDNPAFYQNTVNVTEYQTQLKGLKIVNNAKIAALNGLSIGSKKAQDEQILAIEKYQLALEVENSIGMRFRLIPPGSCYIGSNNDEKGRTPNKGKVYNIEDPTFFNFNAPFYVGKYEVTREQWEKVMSKKKKHSSSFSGQFAPMEEITWNDAVSFCRKLEEIEGVKTGRYRLLTEKEWEYTCRSGTNSAFYFADIKAADSFMVYNNNKIARTAIVGSKRPNAWGIFDMHGNVMEWCLDFFKDYVTNEKRDGNMRNMRGGSWYHTWQECRSSNRARLGPLTQGNMLGFRIMRTVLVELEEIKNLQLIPEKISPAIEL